MDQSASEGTCEVHSGGFGHGVHHPGDKGIHTQWWFQERCAIFGGSYCDGRGGSLHQPRKSRGNRFSHLWLH